MRLIIVLLAFCIVACKVSAVTETYNARCPSGTAVTVSAPGTRAMSAFKHYKALVCAACGVPDCKETRLFKGDREKNDDDPVKTTRNLERLSLVKTNYDADMTNVSYRCPRGPNVRTVGCYRSHTMKECLTGRCNRCRVSSCEVYAGSRRVSSHKAAISRGGVYQVAAGRQKSAASERRNSVGAAGVEDGESAEVIRAPREPANDTERIGRRTETAAAATRDVDEEGGGPKGSLDDSTGRPPSLEGERETEEDGSDWEKVPSTTKASSDDVTMRGRDLSKGDITAMWDKYASYMMIIAGAVVLVISLVSCVLCSCCLTCAIKYPIKKGARIQLDNQSPYCIPSV